MTNCLPILEYHGVDEAPAGARQSFLYVRPRLFALQLKVLRLLGYRGVTLSEGLRLLDEGSSERVISITFDDAYHDILVHALPHLIAAGFSATTYAVSDRLGAFNSWDADVLNVRKPTMSRDDLLRWRDAGMEVGGHTRTHPRLPQCTDAQLEDEIAGGKHALEQLLGEKVTQFCYPYGQYDDRAKAVARTAGYAAAVTIATGRARRDEDRFALPRVAVHGNRGIMVFPVRTLTRYADRKR